MRAVETHLERVTTTTTNPDGSSTTTTRESYHTSSILTDARPKGGGSETKCWDDTGGGFDPTTGEPIPVNPCAIVMCQPSEGTFDPTAIDGPRRRADHTMGDFGPYAALEEILYADAGPDGAVDADVLFADWTMVGGTFVPPLDVGFEIFDPASTEDDSLVLTTNSSLRRAAIHDLQRVTITSRGSRYRVAVIQTTDTDLATTLRLAIQDNPAFHFTAPGGKTRYVGP